MSCGVTNQNFKLFLEIVDAASSGLRSRGTHPACYQWMVPKPASMMVCGGALVPLAWLACTSGKAPLTLNDTYRNRSNICCHPDNVFFREGLAHFSKSYGICKSSCSVLRFAQRPNLFGNRVIKWTNTNHNIP